ncbi:hypothetical protein ACHAWF_006235 [Thalassiosira exigua]
MATVWDSVVSQASKAATQAGEATQVAAAKAKLHADLLVVDRDIRSRKEKFGVDMYAHLEGVTSTQEFYVADDRLINVIRPTLIKAQREVAAYERKRDAMRGKVNLAEANRTGSASIFTAATIGEKLMNAARYAAAGAKEAGAKTELAMIERQILGFKEEFGVELYPVFEAMEDDEGWLPTDRKVRSLYDAAREDVAQMKQSKEEKKEEIKKLDGVEGSGLDVPSVPSAQSTNVHATLGGSGQMGQMGGSAGGGTGGTAGPAPWASASNPAAMAQPAVDHGYGATNAPVSSSYGGMDQSKSLPVGGSDSGFGFMAQSQPPTPAPATSQYAPQQHPSAQHHLPAQEQQQQNLGGMFDPFDGIGSSNPSSSLGASAGNAAGNGAYDPFSGSGGPRPQGGGGNNGLTDADVNLFKY